ncbi:MAG: hypothetical protein NTY98_16140 [Verrucomicrobia bacterium]|nr:hypothetical protein [Verrucomicrobiota bacterium]
MRFNVQTGNRVVMQLAALVLILCSLFVGWGTSTFSRDEMQREIKHQFRGVSGFQGMEQMAVNMVGRGMEGVPYPVDAAKSALYLGPVRIPYWVGCVCSGFALVVIILNTVGYSSVPKMIVLSLLFIGDLVATWAVVNILASGSFGAGALLLLFGSIFGTTVAMRVDHSAQQAQQCPSTHT